MAWTVSWLRPVNAYCYWLSTRQDGVPIQLDAALIASLLVSQCTGRKPTRRTFEMLCFVRQS